MTREEIVTALRHLMVETGSLACLGCGREHNCSTSGCRIMRCAADLLENDAAREWTPVTERMPENEKDVLIAFTRRGLRGDVYTCVGMAFHTDGKTTTEDSSYSWEIGDIDMEYDEEADAYIIPEGWWESVNFDEEFSAVDMPVTHWMPLPEAPEAAMNERQEEIQ